MNPVFHISNDGFEIDTYFSSNNLRLKPVADTRGGGEGGRKPPPIIFTEALVLKTGSTRKFLF